MGFEAPPPQVLSTQTFEEVLGLRNCEPAADVHPPQLAAEMVAT